MSWTSIDSSNPIYSVVHEITEPILSPLRRVIPRLGMFDLAPMAAMFLLGIVFQAVMKL